MSIKAIVGLTGQSGAGKSTVSRIFTDEGFFVIDCDRVVHLLLMQNDTECGRALKSQFPQFFSSGIFDRRKAAPLLFSDRALLDSYNAVIFPFINKEIETYITRVADVGFEYILLDAPTLFEAGADSLCDVIVSCVADRDIRIQRIVLRDLISPEDAAKRFSSQHDEDFFRSRSDYIIENNRGIEDAERTARCTARKIKDNYP